MWLMVGPMPKTAGWRNASLALRDLSRNDKHFTHLSITKTIYFSRFVSAMPAFALIEVSYSNTSCDKSAAEAWICVVSFYGEE